MRVSALRTDSEARVKSRRGPSCHIPAEELAHPFRSLCGIAYGQTGKDDESALRTGFIILTRVSIRYPEQGAEWVRKFLDRDVIGRATAAFDACLAVCSETAHAGTGRALAEALAGAKALEPGRSA